MRRCDDRVQNKLRNTGDEEERLDGEGRGKLMKTRRWMMMKTGKSRCHMETRKATVDAESAS